MAESIFSQQEQQGHHDCRGLADFASQYFNKNQLIWDVGCSVGFYTKYLIDRGHNACGIEGTPSVWDIALTENIFGFDLTKRIPESFLRQGSVLCLEVAEHIPKEYEHIFISNIKNLCSKDLILSWAIKGQGGTRHVNEKDPEYVLPLMDAVGFDYLDEPSQIARNIASKEFYYFKNTIYIFRRR